jgi:sporulation protein YlmC with PRC-barrel domain
VLNGPPPKELTSEQLSDYTVVSSDGKVIGPVDGVVIGIETGTTQYVVVFIKDIYNFGKGAVHEPQDQYLVIPWSYLTLDTANKQLAARVDAEFAGNAPMLNDPPDTSIAGWDTAIELYWTE